jgi:hypothetical protein
MAKPLKYYQPIDIDDLRKVRGYSLSSLMRGRSKIPETPGIYIWRFWPTLAGVDKESFFKMWARWERTQPQFEENAKNSRIGVTVRRTPFGIAESETSLFGFDRDSDKAKNLLEAIESEADTRQMLATTMECLLSAAPPLYIGKADNLRSRLINHFDEQGSTVLAQVRRAEISFDDIYISFIADPVSDANISITTALEEIIQRITNPPFTKRYG